MGIPGLLRILKPYTQPVHVNKYSGKRVGIDAYCWLHKGAYACNFGICEGDQKISSMQPCVKYCMHHINLLRFNGVIPVVVFDGGRLPSKACTENERQRRRDLNLEQARLKLSEGDANGAQELCQRAVEITPLMAHEFIKVLKTEGVEFVVAPYEADAQLAYLSKLSLDKGGVAAVISEDSDLLAYGCSVVIFKMDRFGNGEEVRLDDVMKKRWTSGGPSDSLWFGCFTRELFTGMCVLAGCDFLPSVPGIGIKRAHCLVCKYRDLARVLSSMRFDRKLLVPEGYELGFKQANAIFHHARVYDASTRKLSFLKPLPAPFVSEFNGDLDFLGPELPPSRAFAIAQGRLDPITMCAFDEFADMKPASTQPASTHVARETGSTCRDSHDHHSARKLMQGDVWLGTDEELLPFLAASEPELSQSPLLTRECSFPSHEWPADKGLLTHFASISRRKTSVQSHVEELQPPAGNSSIVTLSPGQKRVLASPPNNNPFKRGKGLDEASEKFLSAIKLGGEPICTGDQYMEDMISMPVQSSQDAGRSSDARWDIHGLSVTGNGATNVKATGRRSLIINFQASVRSESATPAPAASFVKHVESQRDIDGNAAQIVTTAQEAGVIQKPVCADSMSLNMLRTIASLPMRARTDEDDDPIAPSFKNELRREAKAKRQSRSSSMQSRKVEMAASTPSLLKFFQRVSTHSCI